MFMTKYVGRALPAIILLVPKLPLGNAPWPQVLSWARSQMNPLHSPLNTGGRFSKKAFYPSR
jgi:hypothetical protein